MPKEARSKTGWFGVHISKSKVVTVAFNIEAVTRNAILKAKVGKWLDGVDSKWVDSVAYHL